MPSLAVLPDYRYNNKVRKNQMVGNTEYFKNKTFYVVLSPKIRSCTNFRSLNPNRAIVFNYLNRIARVRAARHRKISNTGKGVKIVIN